MIDLAGFAQGEWPRQEAKVSFSFRSPAAPLMPAVMHVCAGRNARGDDEQCKHGRRCRSECLGSRAKRETGMSESAWNPID
jgi:hypothetical protein